MTYVIQTNITGLIILVIVVAHMDWNVSRLQASQRYFLGLVLVNALLLTTEILLEWFSGRPVWGGRTLMLTVTFLYYFLHPVPGALWILYIRSLIIEAKRASWLGRILFFLPVYVNAVFSIISLFGNFTFYIDDHNLYHRGRYFYLLIVAGFFYPVLSILLIIFRQRQIRRREARSLLTFAIPPIIGGILQSIFYGTIMLWIAVSISILIVFLDIQNKIVLSDHLTGLANRRQFDRYLDAYFSNTRNRHLLGGIMIDLNYFKKINDVYGHELGDRALEAAAAVLRNSMRKEDLVARYGGDEFVVLVEVQGYADLEQIAQRIQVNLDQYNALARYPFQLSFSMGYDVLDIRTGLTKRAFIKLLDDKMYAAKRQLLAKEALACE